MRKTVFAAAMSVLAASGLALDAARAEEHPEAGFTRSEIEGIVREYLLSNPEIMYEVQAALEEKQRREQEANSQKVLAEASDDIFNSPYDGVVGNPEGDVTVVEFFDYNCGFCKRALSDMETLVENDNNLRFVLKEFPILGPDSQKAHVVSMAFRALMPEKYGEFHTRLLGNNGRATEESAMKIALELGADEAALREEMKSPEIAEAFNTTYELANKLQITGTPSYVVGKEIVFGALGGDVLSEKIENARQ
ncbi:DsbA family protein [Chelativorans salis]|uniref:DsbA family protein n=1 Tax=Chelativorans salis TaxID=2978478 RepID=A0ABT2LM17_9HYPH|nr:DsbA family protein [Chelativorans sp. EGI FJ00035]MCT7375429.1 DsbA family protein [Chelativorans sp. EGI FJ00035]